MTAGALAWGLTVQCRLLLKMSGLTAGAPTCCRRLHIMQSTSPVGDERPNCRCLHMAIPPREQAYKEEVG